MTNGMTREQARVAREQERMAATLAAAGISADLVANALRLDAAAREDAKRERAHDRARQESAARALDVDAFVAASALKTGGDDSTWSGWSCSGIPATLADGTEVTVKVIVTRK